MESGQDRLVKIMVKIFQDSSLKIADQVTQELIQFAVETCSNELLNVSRLFCKGCKVEIVKGELYLCCTRPDHMLCSCCFAFCDFCCLNSKRTNEKCTSIRKMGQSYAVIPYKTMILFKSLYEKLYS